MTDLLDKDSRPELGELCEYVKNPLFARFCSELKETYHCAESIEYSACSLEKGWNVKFKKSGRSLCTVYLREDYFTVLVVVGKKVKPRVEEILPECTEDLRRIYDQTREGNGQRWLMIDLEDEGALYRDVLRLIQIRRNS